MKKTIRYLLAAMLVLGAVFWMTAAPQKASAAPAQQPQYISSAEFQKNGRQYVIRLQNIALAPGEKVLVPVWSRTGGQDDLKWNETRVLPDGTLEARLTISDYRHPGLFYADVYKQSAAGVCTYLCGTTFEVPQPTAASVTLSAISQEKGTASVRVSGIESPSGVQKVQVPTWSRADQGDLKWYTAAKQQDGSYVLNWRIADHGGRWAGYYCDVYITDGNGFRSYAGGVRADFGLKAEKPEISLDETGSSCTVQVKLLTNPESLTEMLLPVWSAAGGQDDLKWLPMTFDKNTKTWAVTFDTAFLKHTGKCYADLYAKPASGSLTYVTGETFTYAGSTQRVSFSLTDNYAGKPGREQCVYTGRLTGLRASEGISAVRTAVWSEKGGQDDLRWYDMAKQSDGSYAFTLRIASHKTAGKYYADTYAVTADGAYRFLNSSSALVISGAPRAAEISVTDVQPQNGTFRVRIRMEDSPSGISSVSVPVWTQQMGQDDLKWYTAEADGSGAYVARIDAASHKNRSGIYLIDVYAVSGNGITGYAGGITYDFTPEQSAGTQEYFTAEKISDELFARIYGENRSYKPGCIVPREDLRYIRVLYCGFDSQTHEGELIVNQSVAADICEIFRILYENRYQINKIRLVDEYNADDMASIADNNTSAFNFRTVTNNPNEISTHGLGVAIDINPINNPYVWYDENGNLTGEDPDWNLYLDRNAADAAQRHMINEQDLCYRLFTERGWTWGGNWRNPIDYQHFEKRNVSY